MSSAEYQELKCQMDRIERILSKLAGMDQEELRLRDLAATPPPAPREIAEVDQTRALQAEGHYILETQGMEAYKKFWKQQRRAAGSKSRKRAA